MHYYKRLADLGGEAFLILATRLQSAPSFLLLKPDLAIELHVPLHA
jgi:hypothetical protein